VYYINNFLQIMAFQYFIILFPIARSSSRRQSSREVSSSSREVPVPAAEKFQFQQQRSSSSSSRGDLVPGQHQQEIEQQKKVAPVQAAEVRS
jgi:transcriptional regulator GlxA family with amidase domain